MNAAKFAQDQIGTVGSSGSAAGGGAGAEGSSGDVAKMEEEIASLRSTIEAAADAIVEYNRSREQAQTRAQLLESELMAASSSTDALKREILIKQKTLEMLPKALENIKKLQNICADSSTRLLNLSAEWENTRQPLLAKLRAVKARKGERRERSREMVEEMRGAREEMVSMIQELKEKQERAQQLAEELSKLPKNINRALYTHRIMDIITSIGKQNRDIDKITNDIRDIQKQINSATMTLQRSDIIAEEMVYGAANQVKVDKPTVATYRLLKDLRTKFDTLNGVISKIGANERQSRELEVRIDQEMQRVSLNNFQKVKEDLEMIKQENTLLVKQLKAA
jgi:chromosome segregation ATPase